MAETQPSIPQTPNIGEVFMERQKQPDLRPAGPCRRQSLSESVVPPQWGEEPGRSRQGGGATRAGLKEPAGREIHNP